MPISHDLMLAILALNSYNPGYGASLAEGPTDANGNDSDGLGEAGYWVGNARVLDVDLPAGAQEAGFYAVACEWNGQTVISYQGRT